jgi:hypothetical protein
MTTFEEGFVATRYLLGTRGAAVAEGLPQRQSKTRPVGDTRDEGEIEVDAVELATRLQSPDRSTRSQALAHVLKELVVELEGRRVG